VHFQVNLRNGTNLPEIARASLALQEKSLRQREEAMAGVIRTSWTRSHIRGFEVTPISALICCVLVLSFAWPPR
jgi:hypothetical protein